MKLGVVGTAGRELRALLEGGATADLSDEQLLLRFSNGQGGATSEAAFAALVARHGPMVWGTCRRILRDPHAAEDAFQATFLVLVRKAGSVRVEDSLGRWLHGVGVRVAQRARSIEARRNHRDRSMIEPLTSTSASTSPTNPEADLYELRAAIDEEVDRLPATYRSVVVLCHLEGLTRERAADRLGCPVGTVNSRLARASDLLRSRLTRRGLAPSTGGLAVWMVGAEATASSVPARIVGSTVEASSRIASGGTLAGVVPAGVVWLLQTTLKRTAMITLLKTTALGSALMALAACAVGLASQDQPKDQPKDQPATAAANQVATPKPVVIAEPPKKPPTRSDRVAAIVAEWKAANTTFWAEMPKGKTNAEQNELYGKFFPNELSYYQRCLDLANEDTKDLGARDAWLWIISEGMRNNDAIGPRSVPIAKAVEMLLLHFPDDPRVGRYALNIDNLPSNNRAVLTRGLYEKAKSHEAKGVATLALAQYLELEVMFVKSAHTTPEQPKTRYMDYDDAGKPRTFEGSQMVEDSYWKRLKNDDESAMRREYEELYDRVVLEYADIPLNPWRYEGEKVVKNPHPKSLAEHAQAKLDNLHNLAVGKPAPPIEGVDLDGKPLKLSDYQGKIVAVVFWNSGCGPCLAAVPQERALLERLKGKPFAILGVNTDAKPEAALKAVKDYNIAWPQWKDGIEGPIFERYHIRGFPTTFVIDAKGIIREKHAYSNTLDQVVDELLKEMEVKPLDAK